MNTIRRRVRHKKRGTIYEVMGKAQLQIANLPVLDEAILVLYVDEKSGKWWASLEDEFEDGRFEELPT